MNNSKIVQELELLVTSKTDQFKSDIAGLRKEVDILNKRKTETKDLVTGIKAALPTISAYALGLGTASFAIDKLGDSFKRILQFEDALADFSAITGITGIELKKIGVYATDLANKFGTSATDNIEAFKLTIGRLGPEFAKDSVSLKQFGDNINTFSVASGLTAVGAMDALTISLQQFKIPLDNTAYAVNKSTEFMNILAAASKEGAAEIPELSEAIAIAGGIASSMGIRFSELTTSVEMLATANIQGAEAGTAMRNMLARLVSPSGEAESQLNQLGITGEQLRNELGTNGITGALTLLKSGLSKLEKPTDRQNFLFNYFGDRTAVAAEKLLSVVDGMSQFESKLIGTNTVTEQAAIKLDTLNSKWSKFTTQAQNFVDTGIGIQLDKFKDSITSFFGLFSSFGSEDIINQEGVKQFNSWLDKRTNLLPKTLRTEIENKEKIRLLTEQDNQASIRSEKNIKAQIDSLKSQNSELDISSKKYKENLNLITKLQKELDAASGKRGGKSTKDNPIVGSLGDLKNQLSEVNKELESKLVPGSDAFLIAVNKSRELEKAIEQLEIKIQNIKFSDILARAESYNPEIAYGMSVGFTSEYIRGIDDTIRSMPKVPTPFDNMQKDAEKQLQSVIQLGQLFGETIGGAIADGESGLKNALKKILITLIDFLEKEVLIATVSAILKTVFGDFTGLILLGTGIALLEATKAAVNSFDVGTSNIPSDQLAKVHRGEMIIPDDFSSAIRRGDLALIGNNGNRSSAYERKGSAKPEIYVRQTFTNFESGVNSYMQNQNRRYQ
jgi:TP901 family phage tail tape measure protein